jgi:hypothetical protein
MVRSIGRQESGKGRGNDANEEQNAFARLADAAVGLDLAHQLPQNVNGCNVRPRKFQPGNLAELSNHFEAHIMASLGTTRESKVRRKCLACFVVEAPPKARI